jgi:hypothetical protein
VITPADDVRHTVDTLTSDALDELYDDLARYEEVQGDMNERAIDLTRRAERAEAALTRIQALAEEHPAGIDTALIHEALDQEQL